LVLSFQATTNTSIQLTGAPRTQVLELRCCPLVLASSIKEQRHLTI